LLQAIIGAMMRLNDRGLIRSHNTRMFMVDGLIEISTLLQENNAVFISLSVLLGLAIGSFLNVVIYRLPKMMQREWQNNCLELQGQPIADLKQYSLVKPRSACPLCGHMMSALENIPVISYVILKGQCRTCKAPINPRYPLVEALTGILFGFITWKFGFTTNALFAAIFTSALIALTFIDFDTQLLPDDITLPLLWIGLVFNLNTGFTDIKSAIMGAVTGYLALWFIYWLFKFVTGKEGMGYGDFKLLAAIGAWFGWQLLPAVILLSSLLGAVVGVGLIFLTKRGREIPMPFGPFLAIGGFAALFFGTQIAHSYLA
jgi:leader peptidase (prepilin peptidase)/N-methyltransferase